MQFYDTEFMNAQEKEKVLRQWKRFIKNGFQYEHFTDSIYKHLTLHCSFIAHYNREGFFHTYFINPEDTIRFLSQFDNDWQHASVEYGGVAWYRDERYADLNKTMCDDLEPYKETFYEHCHVEARNRDVLKAKKLLDKHGIVFNLEGE